MSSAICLQILLIFLTLKIVFISKNSIEPELSELGLLNYLKPNFTSQHTLVAKTFFEVSGDHCS